MMTTSNAVGGGRDTQAPNSNNNNGNGGGGGDGASRVGLKKGPWTAAEDAMLVEYVRKHGEGNWNAVQRHSGLARCGKSCRLRWANHLRPHLKKGAFSQEEERLIVELHSKYGNKWARMAALLPGRTDNEIKNFWNTRVKRHQRQGIPLYPPDLQPHHHHHQHSSYPTTPTSSFTFQTQLSSSPAELIHTPSHPPTPSPLSPLPSSPSTNNATLPLFDFTLPKTPPLLQTPLRYRRYNSSNSINSADASLPVGNASIGHFSSPLPPLSSSSQHIPYCFSTGLLGGSHSSSSEFHKELARENQKMCSLFTAVTQNQSHPELPSSQFSQSTMCQNNWNSGFDVVDGSNTTPSALAGSKFSGRRTNKRKYGDIGDLELVDSGNGMLEDLLMEAKPLAVNGVSYAEQNYFVFDEQKPKLLGFEELGKDWDPSNSRTLCPEPKPNAEAGVQQDTMAEDLTKLLNFTLPASMPLELCTDSGDISNGQSSVVTDDNIDYEMQQIALLFPTTADQSKTIGPCSWDTLPRIC